MHAHTVTATRIILALGLAGSLFVQAVLVPLLYLDLEGAPAPVRLQVVTIIALGIVAIQVVMVCTWRLLTLVGRDEVFSPLSFRYVDVISAAVATGLLLFWLGAVAAPGDEVAPGMVLLIGGAGGLALGAALVVRVMRALLRQAVEMRAELAEVI